MSLADPEGQRGMRGAGPTEASPIGPPERPDIAFAALRHGDFRPYFLTGTLSMMADNIEHVITYWMIFEAFHSPALAGFAVVSHWSPFLLLGVYVGALADRYDCRKLMQLSQVVFIGASLAWALLFFTGTLQTWHAVVLLIAHGLAGVLWAPTNQLIIHDMVGPRDLQSAIRLNATGRQLGILLGPAVGGALLLVLGPAGGLLVNSLFYVPLTLWLFRMRFTGHGREPVGALAAPRLSLTDAVNTFGGVTGNRAIVTMILLVGLSSLFIGNAFQAQMPEFASAFATAQGELIYAALLAANAAGAVFGGVALESSRLFRRPRAHVAVLLAALWSLAIAAFAVAPTYVVALVALFTAGVLNLGFSAMAQTLVQLEAPAAQRGRVMGLFNMAQLGLRVGSGVTVGVLGSFIGVHASLGLSALAFLAASLALLVFAGAGRAAHRERRPRDP